MVPTMSAGWWVSYILTAALLTFIYGFTTSPWLLLFLGPLVAFFGTGFFSGFGAVTAEIYPTSIRAIGQKEFPVVVGSVTILSLLFVGVNLLVDLTYGYLDPRIRYS